MKWKVANILLVIFCALTTATVNDIEALVAGVQPRVSDY